MTEWANQAGRLVLAQAHTFDEDNVVSYCILALFWFTQGSWRIAMLYKANAFALYQALGVKKNALPGESALQAELRRRRFWACFLLECHSMCELPAVRGITDPYTIPLPWPGSALNAGYSPDPPLYLKSSQDRLGSLYAHFIRGMHIWSSIASLMRDAGGNGLDIHQLEEDTTQWWNMARLSCTISDPWIDDSMDYVHKLLIRLVYHQSMLAINAWRVPLFSGSKHRSSFSTDAALQISAQEALHHAEEISGLAAHIMHFGSSDRILMALPSFPSYAAFCSCTIQLHFVHCKVPNLSEKFATNISKSLQVLRGMAKYWKSAKLMAAFIDVLNLLHAQTDTHLETEPKFLTDAAPLRVPPSSYDYPLPSSMLDFVPFFRPLNGDGVLPSDQEWPPDISIIRTRLKNKAQASQRTALLTPSVDEFYNSHGLQRNESDFKPLVTLDDVELMDLFSGLGSASGYLS
ncbi:hypothetical protein PRZ48_006933 [Zasmidium cellare]|uniref:Transcription factor domain-containing protein n=1 Tax=Zasmidium cellare TaxID=395010 RepID=A0ABR0EHZ1_ZASCE|nr:hypothetical protein PRZ48_006933 [Zasmidium cellare]